MVGFFEKLVANVDSKKITEGLNDIAKVADEYLGKSEKIASGVCEDVANKLKDGYETLTSEENQKELESFVDKAEEGIKKTAEIACNATEGAITGVVGGVERLVEDSAEVVECLSKGEVIGAVGVVAKRGERIVKGALTATATAASLAGNGIQSLVSDKPFATEENVKRLTDLLSLGIIIGVGTYIIDPNMPEGTECGLVTDDDIPGVKNGVFVGDRDDLQGLIKLGEDSHTVHIPSDEITRSMNVRDEFLEMHGFETCPTNFQVHHIFPLSEGGADSVENMVLIDNENHATITAAHDDFYHWGHHQPNETIDDEMELSGIDHRVAGIHGIHGVRGLK